MNNILDMVSIEQKCVDCTSCNKSDRKAIARCSDCANFLCSACVDVHSNMRYFENHIVVQFDDIKYVFRKNMNKNKLNRNNGMASNDEEEFDDQNNKGLLINNKSPSSSSSASSTSSNQCMSNDEGISSYSSNDNITDIHQVNSAMKIDCGVPIHKPLYCKFHSKETLKFFCSTCQIPICSDCIITQHKPPMHLTEHINDSQFKNIKELDILIRNVKENINYYNNEYQLVDQHLNDLQEQLENSKSLIEETYQSYKAIIENRKVD